MTQTLELPQAADTEDGWELCHISARCMDCPPHIRTLCGLRITDQLREDFDDDDPAACRVCLELSQTMICSGCGCRA